MYRGKIRETFGLNEFLIEMGKIMLRGWNTINIGRYEVDGAFVTSNNCLVGVLTSSEYSELLLRISESKTNAGRFIERLFYGYQIS